MRKVIVCNIMSLDGYYAGPGGDVMALPMDAAFDAHNLERMEAAGTVVLGRRSYEGFGSYWPGLADRPHDPDAGQALSETNRQLSRLYDRIEKVVVTDGEGPAPEHPWHATTTVVPRDEIGAWLTQHRQDDGGDILVYGSHVLWNGLLADGFVDELHLMVGAAVLGGGTPAFSAPVGGLTLLGSRRFEGSDNVVLRYAPAADVRGH